MIVSVSIATCDNNPSRASLVNRCLDVMSPTIARIVNYSMNSDSFSSALESAGLKQLLLKSTLDPEPSKSTLPLLCKVIKKAFALRPIS